MKHFLFLGLAFLLFASCDRDDNNSVNQKTDLTVNFKANFGTQPLVIYAQDYSYEAGMRVKFQLFQFYVSDLALLKETASGVDTVKLMDIDLINFQDIQDAAKAKEGINLTLKDVPYGRYKGVYMGLGVSPRLNATSPSDYTPPHPLDGNYWSWARGYIFTKVEGNADIKGDGLYSEKLTFHIGENPFYREKTFPGDIVIDEKNKRLEFEVDLRRVLVAGPSDFLDFRVVTVDHTNNRDIAKFISDNLHAAIIMNYK